MDDRSYVIRLFTSRWVRDGYRRHIKRVEKIENRELVKRWMKKRDQMKDKKTIWTFHGTPKKESIVSIAENGFDITKLGSNKKNTGDYGAGIYLSEYSSTAIKYCDMKGGIILCRVLVGKQYVCPGDTPRGIKLKEGYDSHTSPDGRREIVIFDSDCILPCYAIYV